MGQPPAGTITFLFSDIEGSTRLWEQFPDRMRPALARHDQILREAIAMNKGRLFKAMGDAFCAAFDSAPAALRGALAAQIALAAEPWTTAEPLRVRIALHTGIAEERDGDYFGQPLNRAARLLAAGHGGQTLLSGATQELIGDELPPQTTLLDLGKRRLKDLGRPEQIFQVTHPALAADFPPLRSLDNPDLPNNLPQQTSSFIGREREIRAVKALLGTARLLTLTGTGGAGKTRLSLAVAADLLDQYFDGVWLVELAALADPALVPQAVAEALGIHEESEQPIRGTLAASLKPKHLLLVLDNCEHLIAACADLAAELLKSCPDIHILASSREPLNVTGERTYRVPSLSLPDLTIRPTASVLSQCEAVHLFIERAQSVRPLFAITEANAPAVAAVCHRLDGIPLALELAAARIRALSVEEVNARLDNRFRLLTGGSRTALPRQQTLRALIDWSYDLLTAPEKTLLASLAVFAGGWTLAAAESVCTSERVEDWEVLDLLTSLADKSLVITETEAKQTRYRLLETVRQYAAERLAESSRERETRRGHAGWFLALAEEAAAMLTGPEQEAWLSCLDREHDNLRAALTWLEQPPDGHESGMRLAGALWRFWTVRGLQSEGRRWLGRTLARPVSANWNTPKILAARARALNGAGNLAASQSDFAGACVLHEESLALSRQLGDPKGIANSLSNLGIAAYHQGDFAASQALYEESLALYRQWEDTLGIAFSLNCLGVVASARGDYVGAHGLYEESLTLRRQLGDQQGIANSLGNLADSAAQRGDDTTARNLYMESLTLRRQLGDQQGIAFALLGLGTVAQRQAEFTQARTRLAESISVFQQIGDVYGLAAGLEALAGVEAGRRHAVRAARILGAAASLREKIGSPPEPREQEEQDQLIASVRASLGEAATAAAWNTGRAMTLDIAIDYALMEEK